MPERDSAWFDFEEEKRTRRKGAISLRYTFGIATMAAIVALCFAVMHVVPRYDYEPGRPPAGTREKQHPEPPTERKPPEAAPAPPTEVPLNPEGFDRTPVPLPDPMQHDESPRRLPRRAASRETTTRPPAVQLPTIIVEQKKKPVRRHYAARRKKRVRTASIPRPRAPALARASTWWWAFPPPAYGVFRTYPFWMRYWNSWSGDPYGTPGAPDTANSRVSPGDMINRQLGTTR